MFYPIPSVVADNIVASFRIPETIEVTAITYVNFVVKGAALRWIIRMLTPSVSTTSSDTSKVFFGCPLWDEAFVNVWGAECGEVAPTQFPDPVYTIYFAENVVGVRGKAGVPLAVCE